MRSKFKVKDALTSGGSMRKNWCYSPFLGLKIAIPGAKNSLNEANRKILLRSCNITDFVGHDDQYQSFGLDSSMCLIQQKFNYKVHLEVKYFIPETNYIRLYKQHKYWYNLCTTKWNRSILLTKSENKNIIVFYESIIWIIWWLYGFSEVDT